MYIKCNKQNNKVLYIRLRFIGISTAADLDGSVVRLPVATVQVFGPNPEFLCTM